MATSDWEDDWELCNDDGFVYKRKKRRLDALSAAAPPPPLPDPQAVENHRRHRKRRALIKIKEKYQREIDHWERLSNTLRSLEETAHQRQQQLRQQEEQRQEQASSSSTPLVDSTSPEFVCRALVDEVLLQAEAQEAVIQDVSHLCDVAEAMCSVQDEQLKQSFVDLPIWGSPRELMASLCDE